jgi:hypothetical protein
MRIISFFIVLNITNLSNIPATLKDFLVIVGPSVSVTNTTYSFGNSSGVDSEDQFIAFSMGDSSNWYPVWMSNQSRLIAVTGSVGMRGADVTARKILENGLKDPIYLYGCVSGVPWVRGLYSSAYCLKHVELQAVGTGFLYNSILSDNQRWSLDADGIDVYIATIS